MFGVFFLTHAAQRRERTGYFVKHGRTMPLLPGNIHIFTDKKNKMQLKQFVDENEIIMEFWWNNLLCRFGGKTRESETNSALSKTNKVKCSNGGRSEHKKKLKDDFTAEQLGVFFLSFFVQMLWKECRTTFLCQWQSVRWGTVVWGWDGMWVPPVDWRQRCGCARKSCQEATVRRWRAPDRNCTTRCMMAGVQHAKDTG